MSLDAEPLPQGVVDLPALRGKKEVFADRADAGRRLAEMLRRYRGSAGAVVLAIPAGGIPVALPIAEALELPLSLMVVSKITLPWNSEAGFGAVAFDGTVQLNEEMVQGMRLAPEEVSEGIARTRSKVEGRTARLLDGITPPALAERTAILVDDGLASGFTTRVAIAALRRQRAGAVVVAVPTAPLDTVIELAPRVDALFAANLRPGPVFAVADAYRSWQDVSEQEALELWSKVR
jgi:predicted phosphoribosyltransferase